MFVTMTDITKILQTMPNQSVLQSFVKGSLLSTISGVLLSVEKYPGILMHK